MNTSLGIRHCPECKEDYGRRTYASLQLEPPSNFHRRTTCGKPECIQSGRRRRMAENKKNKTRSIETVDLFIYGKRAIQKYHDLINRRMA